MGEKERIELPHLQGHGCFACGTENPIGLNLRFYKKGDEVCTDITLDKVYEGWEGIAHGGIVSTLLDEVMSWTILYREKVFIVTRSMSVKYIRPIMIGTPLIIKGHVTDTLTLPRIGAEAEIRDKKGGLLVKGSGEFVAVAEDKFSAIPDNYKKEMTLLFKRFEEHSKNVKA
jgi:acyl-coenzyme A thioesterase PaaI-like protein